MGQRIKEFLLKRKDAGLFRELIPVSWHLNDKIIIKGNEYINFSSNDYLGLANHPYLEEAAKKALNNGTGTSSSRLMSGNLELHEELERTIASKKNKSSALIFNSGYQANLGIISSLFGKDDVIFSDRLNHASIIDGILLSGARLFRFRHNDLVRLEQLLKNERNNYKEALIVSETVFSMDGDIAPVSDLIRLKKKYNSMLLMDEAHATGVFGKNGCGVIDNPADSGCVDIIMGTFSKALGGFGAFAAVNTEIRDFLINTCRSFIYSTSLPPSVIASDIASLDMLEAEPYRRIELLKNSKYLRERLSELGFDIRGESQIIPIITGENHKTLEISEKLKHAGYWVTPVRPPTVPAGESRIRLSLTYNHSRDTLDDLIRNMRGIK